MINLARHKPLVKILCTLMVGILAGADILTKPLFAAVSQPADTWEQLLTLPPGSRVRLTFNDGSDVRGRLVQAQTEAVVLEDNEPGASGIRVPQGQSIHDRLTFLRANVSTVQVLSIARARGTPRSIGKKIALGVGIGAAIYFGIALIVCSTNSWCSN
jgi:hypothetical protein